MKEKILQALKTKFKNLGFGDKAFEGVADYLATTITDEANIETAIGGVEGLLKSFQGDIDKRVTDAVAKAKAEAVKSDPKSGDPKPADPKPAEDTPAWAKALIDQNKALADKVNALESEKTTDSRKAALEAKLKDANPKFRDTVLKAFGRMNFPTQEDFEAYLTETEADAAEFAQQEANHGLGALGKPPVASVAGAKALDADIKAWAESKETKVEPKKP